MIYTSPLRYPGGKARLSKFLTNVIDANGLRGCDYFEPYAGGAGAALELLVTDTVSRIHINDADLRIFAFWSSILNETERFVDLIFNIPLTIEEWYHHKTICDNPEQHSLFDLGFAAFYMNRCNRSGVLLDAGPIGGYAQSGKWRLGVRFTRDTLAARVLRIGKLKDHIKVSNLDAIDFLKSSIPRGVARKKSFVYLDPPYVQKGQKLYMNAYGHADHKMLSVYMSKQTNLHWLISYDDNELIRSLYERQQMHLLPIKYSLQKKRSTHELIIANDSTYLPRTYLLPINSMDMRS